MMILLLIKTITTQRKSNVSNRFVPKHPVPLIQQFSLFADKQVFSDLDFLGWYTTTGSGPTEKHIKVHRQICQINECPILLQLDPNSKKMDVSFCSWMFFILLIALFFRHFQYRSLNQ